MVVWVRAGVLQRPTPLSMALRLRSLAFPLSSATRRRCAPRAVACASLAGRRVVSTSVEVSSSPKSPSSTLPLDEPPSLPTPPHPSIPSPQLPYSQPGPSDAVGLSADGAVAVVEPVSGVRLPGPSSSSPSSSPPLPHPPAQPSRTSDPIRSTSRSAEVRSLPPDALPFSVVSSGGKSASWGSLFVPLVELRARARACHRLER